MLERIWEFLFPARCIGCRRRGVALCAPCRQDLPFLTHGVCARCASVRSWRGACPGCRRLSPQLISVRAVCAYEGAARTAVHTLKFRSGRYLAPLMGELLRAEVQRRPIRADVLAPVPIAPGRLRDRGYNQATLLAEQLAEAVDATLVDDLLVRDDRRPQRSLGAAARQTNLLHAIRCVRPEVVSGRRILLVDDVCTTGATLSACAEALVEAGAGRVAALVFARGL